MKLLKTRKFAILITFVVVIVATFLGVRGSLNRHARDIEAMFYNGVYLEEERYTQPGINSHLESSANAALGLATMLDYYPSLADKTEALLSARRELLGAISIDSKIIPNNNMIHAFIELLQEARSIALTDWDAEVATQHWTTFVNAQECIVTSQYHDKVASFRDESNFLADLICMLMPVRPPEAFDSHYVPEIVFP